MQKTLPWSIRTCEKGLLYYYTNWLWRSRGLRYNERRTRETKWLQERKRRILRSHFILLLAIGSLPALLVLTAAFLTSSSSSTLPSFRRHPLRYARASQRSHCQTPAPDRMPYLEDSWGKGRDRRTGAPKVRAARSAGLHKPFECLLVGPWQPWKELHSRGSPREGDVSNVSGSAKWRMVTFSALSLFCSFIVPFELIQVRTHKPITYLMVI